jgi:Flp pilus assembly protein TadD
MGVEYAAVGRLTEAAAAYEEGLAITRQVADTSTGGYLISNLAALRAYTGRLDQAVELMTQSLASARTLSDTASIVYAHNSLAQYFLTAGNVVAAREHVESSIALEGRSPAIYKVIALTNLGLISMAEGQPDSAAASFARALGPAVSGGFAFERLRILTAQVRLAIDRGDRGGATPGDVAKTVADSLGAPDANSMCWCSRRVTEMERSPGASVSSSTASPCWNPGAAGSHCAISSSGSLSPSGRCTKARFALSLPTAIPPPRSMWPNGLARACCSK